MPWAKGTPSSKKLREELAAHIETLRGEFPPKRHCFVLIPGTTADKKTGIRTEVYSRADESTPRPCTDEATGRRFMFEAHQVAIDVKADSKSGGAVDAEAVYGVLKGNFTSDAGREALAARGIYNVRPMAEAPEIGEVTFERPLAITCTTDVFLTEE